MNFLIWSGKRRHGGSMMVWAIQRNVQKPAFSALNKLPAIALTKIRATRQAMLMSSFFVNRRFDEPSSPR